MQGTQYVKRDSVKNYFPMPNVIFELGLNNHELAIYAYLMRIEDRNTYQCIVSYTTLAEKLGCAVNTIAKYVRGLEERGLIRTERTEIVTKDGLKRNGCLKYTILPIHIAVDLCHERKLAELELSAAQQKAKARAEKLGVEFVPADDKQSA